MIKSRSSFQLLNFPLWVLVLYLIIARRKPADADDLANRLILLKDFYYSLPLPSTWLERQLVTLLINWINTEESQLIKQLSPFGALGLLNE